MSQEVTAVVSEDLKQALQERAREVGGTVAEQVRAALGSYVAQDSPQERSSVELSMNAKRETQVKVKVYAGDDPETLADAGARAVALYNDLVAEVSPPPAAAFAATISAAAGA